MNNPSPLVPQGTQSPRGKSSLYFKVLMILAVHVVLIGGMLLQGCKDTSKEQAKDPSISQAGGDTSLPSNSVAAGDTAVPPVNTMVMSNQAMSTIPAGQPLAAQGTLTPSVSPTSVATPAPAVPASEVMGDGKDYVIAKGDTFGAIARRRPWRMPIPASPPGNSRSDRRFRFPRPRALSPRPVPARAPLHSMQRQMAQATLSNPAIPWAELPGFMAPATRRSWL
jgi:LysM repeat protein